MPSRTFTLPTLADEHLLIVGRWRKQPGERLAGGEPLLEAYSERYDWDIPAPCAGVLAEIRAVVGATVSHGDALAVIVAETEDAPPTARISPLAAIEARARGVAVAALRGSGPGGRIMRADVLSAAKPAADTLLPFTAAQQARATQVVAIRRAIPHASHATALVLDAVDVDRRKRQAAWQARERFALQRLPYLVFAALTALRTVGDLNALFTPEGIAKRPACHLAVVVPEDVSMNLEQVAGAAPSSGVIRNAEQFALVGIARRLNALSAGGDTEGATFAVRVMSGLLATATLAPGHSACLTLGAATKRAGVSPSGDVLVQSVVHACLTWDARLLDESNAARYLAEMQRILDASSAA